MSDNNLDFLSIFGGESNLDLGSGQTNIDALFTQPEKTPQPAVLVIEAPTAESDTVPDANTQPEPQPEKQDQSAEDPAPSNPAEDPPRGFRPCGPLHRLGRR